jgi:hypothetical protein
MHAMLDPACTIDHAAGRSSCSSLRTAMVHRVHDPDDQRPRRARTMDTIVPCRTTITDRFPVASFVIRTPRRRFFEVACATDPRLFHTDWSGRRTRENFYSSGNEGVLVNERGDVAWMMPPQVLRQFAGARRLYYALATYGGRNGEDPRFTIAPDALERIPFVAIASDFTGRSLDRRRLGGAPPSSAAYGAAANVPLRWGGDAVLEAERRARETTTAPQRTRGLEYDDGYDPQLWGNAGDDGDDADYAGDAVVPMSAADDDENVDDDGEAYGRGCACPGRVLSFGTGEPELEDGASRHAGGSAMSSRAFDVNGEELEDGASRDRMGARMGSRAFGGEDEELEDGASRHRVGGRMGSRAFGGEDEELEDGASRNRVGSRAMGYGGRGGAAIAGQLRTPIGTPRHRDFRTSEAEESLPIGPATRGLGVEPLDTTTLGIADKVRLLRIVARADSGADAYAAVHADPPRDGAGWGLLWGLLLFGQRDGTLGRVLRRARTREQALVADGTLAIDQTMTQLFGDSLDAMLRQLDPDATRDPETRLAAIDGAPLWEEPWLSRFRAAGRVAYVQAAQNEEAVLEVCDPMLPIARDLGLVTPRRLACVLDRAVHMGVGGARSWILRVVGPIQSEADRDAALTALGCAGDLAAAQRRLGLVPDGRWGPLTHAAIARALRALGSATPVRVLEPAAMVDALRRAAQAEGFGARIDALLAVGNELDDAIAYDLT